MAVRSGTAGDPDSVVDSGCAEGTTCYYAGFASDSGGNYSAGTNVAARPPSDSAIAWVYSTGAASLVPPSPLPGIAAFTASNDRRLHSFDSATGLWPSGWTPPLMNEPAQGRSPVVNLPTTTIGGTGAVIFAGSQDGHVYAFDASDGSELWQSAEELGSEVQAAPSVMFTDFGAPFNLVVASARDLAGAATVYGLDPSDGSTVWSFDNGGGEENAIGVVSAQASLNWSTSPPRAFFASRAHSPDSDTAWCLELAAGPASLLWSQPVGDSDGAASLSGGAVYVGTNTGQVAALDPDTGEALWSAPFITGDGPGVKSWVWRIAAGSRLFFSTSSFFHGVTDNGPGTAPTAFWDGGVVEQKKLKASDPGRE